MSSLPPEANLTEIHRARVEYLTRSSASTLIGACVCGLVLVALHLGHVSTPALFAWFGVLTAVYVGRAVHFRAWRARNAEGHQSARDWRLFVAGVVGAAATWGASWGFFPLSDASDASHFASTVISAIAAASVISLGVFVALERVFLALVILPLIPVYWFTGSPVAPQATFVALAYLGVLLKLTDEMGGTMTRMFEQRVENARLVADLSAAKTAAESLSGSLSSQLAAQRATEVALISAKEQAEQAARAKSEFLANMSHEIRTPMNGVLGMAELLLRTDLGKKQRNFAETIRRSGENLLGIINDILDFSKIEAGKLEIQDVAFDLGVLLEDAGVIFAPRAEQGGVGFTCAFDARAHAAYRGDPDRIQQILTNLIGNALKFTRDGVVAVKAFVAASDGDTSQVRFEVRDTGIGIAPEHQARIFDSFVQADGSTTRKFGGTGLGLAICRQLVQLMGGQIGLDSAPGKGSTFWFQVPLRSTDALPASGRVKRANFEGCRVLVADQNREHRELLELQLGAWRCEFKSVTSRDAAVETLRRAGRDGQPFDCVITDHGFEGDGLGFVAALRRSGLDPRPKFVMLAGITALQETGQWLDAGVDAYVNKPLRQRELQEALAKVLQDNAEDVALAASGPWTMPDSEPMFAARVLVAEDNAVNQELMRSMLEGLGCRIEIATNGREAVEALTDLELDSRHDPFKLVLMDCQMPELDGFAATRVIREGELREGLPRLPIIAITANALNGDRERCLDAGMDDYLTKPFTRAQLVEVLQRWLPLEATLNKSASAGAPAAAPPAPAVPARRSVLDLVALGKIRALQRPDAPDILAKVVTLYREAAPRLLKEMQQAITSGDAPQLQRAAHSLKSSSASLGATACADLCRDLEALGRDGKAAAAASKVDVLEFELEAALAALDDTLREGSANAA
ncbi:MAG: response regulator [Gammaproteobacteria bacterium]